MNRHATLSKCVLAFAGLLLLLSHGNDLSAQQQTMTVKVPYKGKSYYGQPLAWDGRELMLLRRNGKISILPVSSTKDYEKVSDKFKPQSSETIRVSLQKEFGRKYQVSKTRNFIVVHPPGDYQIWAMPFEKLYQRFDEYFSSRGFHLNEPEFPMVAVVLRTRGEFDRFLKAYHDYDRHILGYYSPRSNRIITYDQSAGKMNNQSWFFTADTIVHEATHQTAFNTGIHSRYAPVPRWISEGLAMLFEAPGVNNSMYYTKQIDRINRERLIEIKGFYKRGLVKGNLKDLVTSDHLFRSNPSLAYSMSWALTFYLSEKRPKAYQAFLQSDAARSDFSGYTSKARAKAFSKEFGSKFGDLEARMKTFITGLDIPPARKK